MLYPWGFTAADGIEPQSWRQSPGWKLSPVLSPLPSQVRTNRLKEQCAPEWSSTQTGLCGLCKRCAHKMPTAQLGTPAQPWSPLLPPACPYSFPQAGESQVPCKAPPDLEEFDQMLLDQTQDEARCSLVSWTGTRKHAPCCFHFGAGPSWSLSPTSPCSPIRKCRGRGYTLPGKRHSPGPSNHGDRKEQSKRGGKGQEGTSETHFSFSGVRDFHSEVPRFSLNYYKFP